MVAPVITDNLVNLTNGIPQVINEKVVYKLVPFYLTWQFGVAVLLFIALICVIAYAWFRISLRNRLNVIVHVEDKSRQFFSFKNFVGSKFELPTFEKDKDGKIKKFTYFFRHECLETGYFGRYIEYDYKNPEPRKFERFGFSLDMEYISALLNTELAVDLLLARKFKEFVTMMLWLIAIGVLLILVISGYNLYLVSNTPHVTSCSIALTNETITTMKAVSGFIK